VSNPVARRLLTLTMRSAILRSETSHERPGKGAGHAGTDNYVYVFRYGNHQAMFVVSAGVIATDPIGYGRPQAVVTYVDEIKKVTNQPIKYLIYSHHHFDHIAGGKPFKDAGVVVAPHGVVGTVGRRDARFPPALAPKLRGAS
jgi:glyoxylase-like metal-dependent hydrolase (beta-lactamase superfamily II)